MCYDVEGDVTCVVFRDRHDAVRVYAQRWPVAFQRAQQRHDVITCGIDAGRSVVRQHHLVAGRGQRLHELTDERRAVANDPAASPQHDGCGSGCRVVVREEVEGQRPPVAGGVRNAGLRAGQQVCTRFRCGSERRARRYRAARTAGGGRKQQDQQAH